MITRPLEGYIVCNQEYCRSILLMLAGLLIIIDIRLVKYLNKLIEQNHRFIKKITKPMMIFKALHSAKVSIDGI